MTLFQHFGHGINAPAFLVQVGVNVKIKRGAALGRENAWQEGR